MEIIPLGGAGTVTGSRFLVTSEKTRILVDCGLFQGLKRLRERNREPLSFDPARLDGVVLTHAHLDHSGYLPVLVREGFTGPVFATPPTTDLLPILLTDAGRLQEEDARWATKKGFSKHRPALPLFDEEDARRVEEHVKAIEFGKETSIGSLSFRFSRSGHLLGAAAVRIEDREGDSVVFSGDLGRPDDPLHLAPEPRPAAHRLVLESTYGDRSHPDRDAEEVLAESMLSTLRSGGIVMVPSFAVGRAQLILLLIHRLMRREVLPRVPVFLNSPMAIRASRVHLMHPDELRPTEEELTAALELPTWVQHVDESRELNQRRGPMIIVAGAGMLTGGRILHHLAAFGQDARNALLLTGYQAEGTRGRDLLRGQRSIRMHGRWFEVSCRIEQLDLLSGHADREELIEWARSAPAPGDGAFLVHGEPGPADHLRKRLEDLPGWSATVAEEGRTLG
ncbi:MAG: MBL fold metallo-hydrolase [Gemmatimonadota bacterium]